MFKKDLEFNYPSDLVAKVPSRPTRVAWVPARSDVTEITIPQLLNEAFVPGDLLVINDTQVIPARLFAMSGEEILFLQPEGQVYLTAPSKNWNVLFMARDHKEGDIIRLPAEVTARLSEKGLPQKLEISEPIGADYLTEHGEMALPPYVQYARGSRHSQNQDLEWYQTAWAERLGSVAAPTASLHFQNSDLEQLKARGVHVCKLTLHVGAGTFLPVRAEKLEEHLMHEESYALGEPLIQALMLTKAKGGRVWAMGTTVTRALETWAMTGRARGNTKLLIYPPYEFRVVNGLLTNFHQPQSTLLALVMAFAGVEKVKSVYNWAITNRLRLFSYGDLSVWTR